MKIAVLGDIHGNIEALKAAYDRAVGENAEKVCHLGDLGGYAPFVNEVVDFLIEHKIEGVQGNYDDAVANGKEHCGCRYVDPLQAQMSTLSFEWTKRHASQRSKDYMKSLPFVLCLSSSGFMVKMFHATPLKNNLYWHEDRDDRFFTDMGERASADVLIYGHTHVPYRKDIGGKTFINAGSVGKPKDKDNRACFALIETTARGVKADFIRVPYDIEKTAAAILGSGLPRCFADKLRQAE